MKPTKQKKPRKQKVQVEMKSSVTEEIKSTTLSIENNTNKQKPRPSLGIGKLLTKVKNA